MYSVGIFEVACATAVWILSRSIYRLFLHPLSGIPGPRLAAITSMYGAYYDIPVETCYTKKIIQLHEQYGPIVRIFPDQVHVLDMKSYDEVFKTNSRFRKADVPTYNNAIFDGSFFSTLDPGHARVRRGAYLPFFSRQSIFQLEGSIHRQLLKFFKILEHKVDTSPNEPIDLTRGYKCVTADTIMEYVCRKSLRFLDAPNFNAPLIVALDNWFASIPKAWYFPRFDRFMFNIVRRLPEALIKQIAPVLMEINYIRGQNNARVRELLAANESVLETKGPRSLLENAIAIRPETGSARFSENDLTSDVFILFSAGTDTTANTLAVGTWHLMNDHKARERLVNELRGAISDPRSDDLKSWQELEKLPYLSAVIKESLRLSFGAAHRMARVSLDTEHIVNGHRIPAGNKICHSNSAMHLSEKYFEDADLFKPERWLAEDVRELEHNLISFPRGPRSCIGQNLAWAELYLGFAYMFRRFEIHNAGTTADGMDWTDYFVPYTKEHLMVTLSLARS